MGTRVCRMETNKSLDVQNQHFILYVYSIDEILNCSSIAYKFAISQVTALEFINFHENTAVKGGVL